MGGPPPMNMWWPLRCHGAVVLASLACLAGAWPWDPTPPAQGSLDPLRVLAEPASPGVGVGVTRPVSPVVPVVPPEPGLEAESACEGKESQWAMCTLQRCDSCIPVHCEFTEWDVWKPLGGCSGLGTRKRIISRQSNECGRPCDGVMEETQIRKEFQQGSCMLEDADCVWADWSDWSHCGDCDACPKDRLAQSHRTRSIEREARGDGAPCVGSMNQTTPCGMDTPRDCQFTTWSEWTECSASCGGGWRAQIRRIKREAEYGGMPCDGNLRETFPCNEQPCGEPVDCEVGSWGDWSSCSGFHIARNQHQMMRSRRIARYAQNGGKACDEAIEETMGCPEGDRINWCTYSPWTAWTQCTATCDGGQQERSRTFRGSKHCKQLELAPLVEIRGCSHDPCRGSCQLSLWTEWSNCSEPCGKGMTMRTRDVEVPASNGRMCMAALKESKACLVERNCAIQDCKWGQWGEWSRCNSPCAGGIRMRARAIEVPPRPGGAECPAEDKMQVEGCNMKSCEECIDGEWSNWREWGSCTATCFPAYRHRTRGMVQEANHCGRQITGPQDEYEMCSNLEPCEQTQDCKLSHWTEWSECSSECFGVSERHRKVTQTASRYGRPCDEKDVKEVRGCNPGVYEDVPTACLLMGPTPCIFEHWEGWSGCSATCDGGQKTRMRTIVAQGMHGGAGCLGSLSEMAPCNMDPCDPSRVCINCEWGKWSEWGTCSGCGGQRYRQRKVAQTPNWCGRPCEKADAKETQLCEEVCDKAFCAWSEWREAGECSATCGSATKMRSRELQLFQGTPENETDALFIGSRAMNCEGEQRDQVACSPKSCDPSCVVEDCELGPWSEWGKPECDQLCTRHRLITALNKCGGEPCSGSLVQTKNCHKDCGQVLNCVVSKWTEWSHCNLRQMTRSRTIEQEPQNGGLHCPTNMEELKPCDTDYRRRDCQFEDWNDWGSCTKLCGGGIRHRIRRVEVPSKNRGTPCSGDMEDFEECNTQHCAEDQVRDCLMGAWTAWKHCDSNNQQKRRREIDLQPLYGGVPCNGSLHEVRPCQVAIDCKVSPWAPWDECDKSCDGGQQQRQRQVVKNPRNNGKICPRELVMIRGCNLDPCPSAVNCQESDWSQWSECSTTCGAGMQERSRGVTHRLSHCGEGCLGNLTEVRACAADLPPCSDCKTCRWSEWGQWTSCSRHCGGGQHHRHRNITRNPDPGCGSCEAKDKVYTEPCNVMPCSDNDLCIDGEWNQWQDWGVCSTSCEGGETFRIRTMRRENTACGKPAEGRSREEGPCMVGIPCSETEDCEFSEWGPWSDCSASCAGVKKRSRTIAIHGRGKDGLFCEGALNETSPCAFGQNQTFLNWRSPNLYMVVDQVPDNNLDGKGPIINGAPLMRFSRVVLDPGGGTWLDLLVSRDPDGTHHYNPADASLNGKQGVFGNINLLSHTTADLELQLVETGTTTPVVVNDLLLKIFDMDKRTDKIAHMVQVNSNCEEYYLSKGSQYLVRGECSPSGESKATFWKPIVADPGCTDGNAFDLDLSRVTVSNLDEKGPDIHLAPELRYERAAVVRGIPLDLVFSVKPGSHYSPRDTHKNGYDGRFGRINVQPDAKTSMFNVRFVNSATKELFTMPKLNFTVFDLDKMSDVVTKKIEASGFAQWYFPNGLPKWEGRVNHHRKDSGFMFAGKDVNVTDPEYPDPASLSLVQSAASVTLFYEEKAEFDFGVHVTQTGPMPNIKTDRDFIFAGKYCVPWEDERRLSATRGLAPGGWLGTASTVPPMPTLAPAQPASLRGAPEEMTTAAPPQQRGFRLPSFDSFHLPKLPLDRLGLGGSSGEEQQPEAGGIQGPTAPLQNHCPHGPERPMVQDVGPASLTAAEEQRAVAIRFRSVQTIKITLHVEKGRCGHNFLFAGKACVSGSCDDCVGVSGCRFSTWEAWGPCDKECGGGSSNRTRDVVRVPRSSGQVAECSGPIQSVRSCNTHSCGKGCQPVHCKWGEWTEWTPCHSCASQRKRHRGIAQMPDCGGQPCDPGDSEEIKPCKEQCDHGKSYCAWETWSSWSACSVSCGCGRKQRTRGVKRVPGERPDSPDLQAKFDYSTLQAHVEGAKARRVQVMIAAFAAGSLTFIAGLVAWRSLRRRVAPGTESGDRPRVTGGEPLQGTS